MIPSAPPRPEPTTNQRVQGGPYAVFAGRECARALAFMKIDEESCTGDIGGATEQQLKTLADWKAKFDAKYRVVGKVIA